MKHLPFAALLLAASLASAQQPAPPPGHDHTNASGEIPGLKKELIAGITEADFLKLGDKPKTARITLVATFNADNYGMNFNGWSKGKAIYTIPKDWTVEVTFINPSPIPHSAIVVDIDTIRKLQMGEPAFKGAGVPNAAVGVSFKKVDFTFVADEAGEYAIACGFPAHAMNGHWLALNVSEEAKTPTLKLGDAPAKEAVK